MIWGKTYVKSTKFTEKRKVFLYLPRTLKCGRSAWWQYVYRQWWEAPNRYPGGDGSHWEYTEINDLKTKESS